MVRQFKLFGTLEIVEDGAPSQLIQSLRGCALVSYLIVTREAQTREHLADLLWESTSTKQALRRLRQLLHRTRSLIPELQVTRRTASFTLHPDSIVDLYQLDEALTSDSLAEIEEGLRLSQGELLEGFYVEGAPRFNEWLLAEQERLRHRLLVAYRQLYEAHVGREGWTAAADVARRWLTVDELNEEALYHLLRALSAGGQLFEARQEYTLFRDALKREVGAEPGKATATFYEEIKAQLQARERPSLASASRHGSVWDVDVGFQPEWPQAGELAEVGQLPAQSILPYQRNEDFIGRKQTLLDLADRLLPWPDKEQTRLRAVAVTGMGGLGKTQLAVEFAYRYGRFYPGGVFWISFADAESVAEEVADLGGVQGKGLYQEATQLSLAEQVSLVQKSWQEPISRLLIFDNCENEDLLAKWLPIRGGCRVLITSRRGTWPRELNVGSLLLPLLVARDALALLRQLVPRITEGEALRVATELGHLPLALHLAGGFLRRYQQITVAAYLSQLRDNYLFDHPSLKGRGVSLSPTKHILNVGRTFAINLEQLDPTDEVGNLARLLLARAACFAPGEPIARELLLATVVKPKEELMPMLLAEDGLQRLLNLGLLQQVSRNAVSIHRLLALFAKEELADDHQAQTTVEKTVKESIASYVENRGTLFSSLPITPTHVRYLIQNSASETNISRAELADYFGAYLNGVANYEESKLYIQLALSIYKEIYGLNHQATSLSLNNLGALYMRLGAYQKANAYFEQSFAIQKSILGNGEAGVAYAQNNLGYLLILQGDYAMAQQHLEKTVVQYEQIWGVDHPRTATALNNLGVAFLNQNNAAAARPLIAGSLKIRQIKLGEEDAYTAVSLQNMGLLHLQLDELEQAKTYLERALEVREKVVGQNHPHTARSLIALASLALKQGNEQDAHTHLEHALRIQKTVFNGDHPEMLLTFKYLGQLNQTRGDKVLAQTYYERALSLLENTASSKHPDLVIIKAYLNDKAI